MGNTNDRNAGSVVAGFVYLIYYFLYRLLTMGVDETVSLEKYEDVGVETGNERTYYQLKHTSATTHTHVERMKNRDAVLWKTLSMWIDKIKEGRNEDEQRRWIGESEFVLLSNKSTEENTFFLKVDAYQKDGKWDDLKKYIEEQAAKGERSTPKNIYDYTKDVNDYPLLKEFLNKVRPEFKSDDDILEDIQYWLVNQQHFKAPNAKVLRATLYGRLCEMLRGKEIEFNMESFHDMFGELFTKIKERKFVPKNRKVRVPDKPRKQTFIRQLVEIDDVMAKKWTNIWLDLLCIGITPFIFTSCFMVCDVVEDDDSGQAMQFIERGGNNLLSNAALSDSRVYRPTREHHIIYVAVDSREEYLLHKDQISVKCNGEKKNFTILVDDPTGKSLVRKKNKVISLNKGRNRFQLWFKSHRTAKDSIDIEVIVPDNAGTDNT